MSGKEEVRVVTHLEYGLLDMDQYGKYSGVTIQIFQDIEAISHLRFNISHLVGYTSSNFTPGDFFINQYVPLLSAGEADLAGNYYFFVYTRALQATPLFALVTERFRAFFAQPDFAGIRNLYLSPFHWSLLVSYLCMIVAMILASVVLMWLSASTVRKGRLTILESVNEGSWWILTLFSMKNYSFPTAANSCRMFVVTSSVFFFLVYSLYSAFLISALRSFSNPITSFKDILSHKFTIYANPSVNFLLSKTDYRQPLCCTNTNLQSMILALHGGHAHVDHADALKFYSNVLGLSEDNICNMLSFVPISSSTSSGFYVARNFRHRKVLNNKLARLLEFGLLHKYNKQYLQGILHFCAHTSNKPVQKILGMSQVGSLFAILGLTFPFIFILLVAERIQHLRSFKSIKADTKRGRI